MTIRTSFRPVLAIIVGMFLGTVHTSAHAEEQPAESAKPKVKPIRALLIVGGCCHDYTRQKKILTEGISSRAYVEWEIVHQGGTATDSKIPYYDNPDWAKGFDIVVHNECFSDIPDPQWTEKILKPHKAGTPAIVIHCAMHCYRDKTDEWFKFLGVTSHQHGAHYPFDVVNIKPKHPIMQGFGNVWTTPKGELYQIAKLWDTATPLAYAMSRETMKQEPCIWINQYGNTRVFGTTVGHYNEEMEDPVFLNYVTRGLLWATDKLQPEYEQPFLKVKKIQVPQNLALNQPVTASGSQEGHPADHGNDGKEDTRWCSPDGGHGYTWQVDLGKPQTLTGARILWESDNKHYKYKLEGSADGQAWQTLADHSRGIVDTQEHVLKFDAKEIRLVRLTFLGADPGAWGSFWELEIHGDKLVEKTVNSLSQSKPRPVGGQGILRDLKVPTDFQATVFAAPPDVTYPTCLATDLHGRVFVGIDENGSLDVKAGRGRIVRCVDTDDDGRADQFTTFAKLDSPRGLVADGNSLYVQHPPFVSVYHDDNQDGVADRSEVLIKGLGFDLSFRGADHTTNGMQLGIDGWLYVAVGDYGFVDATGADGKHLQLRGGGVVRFRPDGTELEIVSRGQRNIYDVAIDPLLNLFTRDNTNDGGGWNVRLSHVIPQGQYGYPSLFVNFPQEIVAPLADYGGGSPCGSLFIDDTRLAPEFAQTLYTCDWGRSIVYRHPLQRHGAGFTAEQEPFVEIPRPTDMEIDGRARIYISSWKDGGFNFSRPDVGYVICLTPKEPATIPLQELSRLAERDLLQQLASPSHVQRLHAQRELLRRGVQADTVSALHALIQSDHEVTVRVAALWTLKQLLGPASHAFLQSLARDETMQEFALRALADRLPQNGDVPVEPFLVGLRSTNSRVRLQAVLGLTRLARPQEAAALVPLTVDADPLVAHVAVRGLVDLQGASACLKGLSSPAYAAGCLRVLQELHLPEVVAGLQQRLQGSTDNGQRRGLLTALCRLCRRENDWKGDWWTTRPDTTGPYYDPVDWALTSQIRETLMQVLESGDRETVKWLLPELKRHRIDFPSLLKATVQLGSEDRDFRDRAVELLSPRTDLDQSAAAFLASVLTEAAAAPAAQSGALRGLARNLDQPGVTDVAVPAMAQLLAANTLHGDVSIAVDEFLRDPRQAGRVALWQQLAASDRPAMTFLGYAVLLQVSEQGKGDPAQLNAARRAIETGWQQSPLTLLRAVARTQAESQSLQVRQHLQSEVPELQSAARQTAQRLELDQPADPMVPLISTLNFEKVQAEARSGGDVPQGQRLFARQGCVACHTVSPGETLKGPMLTGIAARYKREELVESILKPSQKIAQGFESQFFVMADGRVHEGFVVREAADEIELRTNNGTSMLINKSDIEERGKRTISMMPEKLVDTLNVQQLASLLAYLESLKAN